VRLHRYLSAAALATFALCAHAAESYPTRPVRVIDPYAPGGSTEAQARIIVAKLSEALGQPVIVESRPGAGSSVGTQIVAQATADGYTLLFTNPGFVTVPAMTRKAPFDPVKDFAPVIRIGTQPQILVVHPSLPGDFREFIAYAKANPGKLNYGSTGTGGGSHLGMEYFASAAGIKLVHVPYKGSSPASTAIVANEVQLGVFTANSVLPHIRSGRMRALGVTSQKRSTTVPDVPTTREGGLSGFEVVSWTAMFAPIGTPARIVEKLNQHLDAALRMPDVRERLLKLGVEPGGGSPRELAAFVAAQLRMWNKVIEDAKIARE
jgi:tripartite-type tricarboxylate transporter receptor subunit TctC